MMLLYFCLFVDHVSKSVVFAFGAFVYNFNDTISIFKTIYICIYYNEFIFEINFSGIMLKLFIILAILYASMWLKFVQHN